MVTDTLLTGNRNGYAPNSYAAMFNLGAALQNAADEQIRETRLKATEEKIRKARLVANPVDLSLDFMEMAIAGIRDNMPPPTKAILDRS